LSMRDNSTGQLKIVRRQEEEKSFSIEWNG